MRTRRLIDRLRLLPFLGTGVYLFLLLVAVYVDGIAWDIIGQWFGIAPICGMMLSWSCKGLFCGYWHLQCYLPCLPCLAVDICIVSGASEYAVIGHNAVLLGIVVMSIYNGLKTYKG